MVIKRLIFTVLASFLCWWGMWHAVRIGFARTLVGYAADQRSDKPTTLIVHLAGVTDAQGAVDRAVTASPKDGQTHLARAAVLQSLGDYPQSRDEFERAVQVRPQDYFLWMMLGVTRDQTVDQQGALRALEQSVVLAPSYAQPHWQLGNLLLRMGRLDRAFEELRLAAQSNPSLWSNIDDLAWGVYGHDPNIVVRVVRPDTDTARMALALFFARQNQGAAALDQFHAIRIRDEKAIESLQDELLKVRAFPEAYEVWATIHNAPLPVNGGPNAGTIRDGGFEGVLTVGQTGFGWQITPDVTNVAMSIDEGAHQGGARSLRLDFHGNSDPALPLVTQIILVKPQTRYHLGLFALSKELLSAAAPVITLVDASDAKNAVLAETPPLRSDPGVWREFAVDFTTGAATSAITIKLARQACANNPCPAFGTVWLDSVSLESR
jgi:hypothetical protein